MSPVLRGESQPLPPKEIRTLRESMDRDYSDAVVPTSSGPYLVIRVPHREPDFLRDLEAAVDMLPYRDLKGFRGVLLIGDRSHMGVSADMLRALFDGRREAENEWVHRERLAMDPWTFRVGKMPSDPQRRLRAVFRVDVESVEELDEDDFDRLAEMLPRVKATSPGQTRPAYAYLVGEGDHVSMDGGTFFTELERRRRRTAERHERLRQHQIDEKHDLVLAHLDRIMKERGMGPAPRSTSRPASAPPVPPASTSELPPITPPPDAPVRRAPAIEPPAPRAPGPFQAAERHPEAVAMLRHAMTEGGYKLKERLTVRELPIAIAAARLDRYPTRVLVTFHSELTPDDARRILSAGRHVGAELLLAVADGVAEGVDRVTLATNLKVIRPQDVSDLRFD